MKLFGKAFARRLFSALIAVILTLVALEVLLRTTHLFGARLSWTMPDPLIGWRMMPNAAYWYEDENDHPITGRFNSHGWRDRERSREKPDSTYRVAVLGDSFVEAIQVEQERTSLWLAEEKLDGEFPFDVEVMNFGRPGATTSEELLILKNDVVKFSPDMVALFFMPRTDIEDVTRETAPEAIRPYYSVSGDGKLLLDLSFRETLSYKVKGIVSLLTRNSALASLIVERRRRWIMDKVKSRFRQEEEELGGFLTLCTDSPDEAYARSYELNKRLIGEAARFCRERGWDFLLVGMETVAYEPSAAARYREMDSSFDPDFFDRDLAALADELGVAYLGLQGPFREARLRTGKDLRWIHWNYEGHEVAAAALGEKLGELLK